MPSFEIAKKVPDRITEPLHEYLEADGRIFCFLESTKAFLGAWKLLPWPEKESPKTIPRPIFETRASAEGYTDLLGEMLFTSGTNGFLTYLSNVLVPIFQAQPNLLKSSETITLEEVLEFSSLPDLYEYLSERKMNALSFSGFQSVARFFDKRVGIAIFRTSSEQKIGERIIEVRNLIVHHRGKVNRRFLRKVPQGFKLGQQIKIAHDQLVEDLDFLAETAFRLDTALVKKFGLPNKQVRLFFDLDEKKMDETLRADGYKRADGIDLLLKIPSTPRKKK